MIHCVEFHIRLYEIYEKTPVRCDMTSTCIFVCAYYIFWYIFVIIICTCIDECMYVDYFLYSGVDYFLIFIWHIVCDLLFHDVFMYLCYLCSYYYFLYSFAILWVIFVRWLLYGSTCMYTCVWIIFLIFIIIFWGIIC